jgi:two-component system, NtrC family, response regulator HydG
MTLARQFWLDLGGEGNLPDDFAAPFARHQWPGNVRELRIAVQDRLLHGGETSLEARPFPAPAKDHLAEVIDQDLPFVRARKEVVAEFERRYVARALRLAEHSVGRAAAASGIAHRYFQVLKSRRSST